MPPVKTSLRAGPLSLIYAEGGLRTVCLGEREVLRRIYAAVRDENWGTVPATLSQETIRAAPDSFQISYRAEHRRPGLSFVWEGRIIGHPDGAIAFTFNGSAQTSFQRNRIGFCVLHPIRECAGGPCVVTHGDGTVEAGRFPERIAPHQPFRDIRVLSSRVSSSLWADVTFEGDVFEMEDQRNWTDASFKTYCTPLDIPFPVQVAAGTVIRQSVTLRLRGPRVRFKPAPPEAAVEITFPGDPPVPLPRLGLCVAGGEPPLTAPAADRLRALRLDHLRVDLTLSDPAYPALLERGRAEAESLGVRLLAALHLSQDAGAELKALGARISHAGLPPGGWLVFSRDAKCTPEGLLGLARRHLEGAAPPAVFLGGTDAYFAELNRDQPALAGADGVVFSLNPQVHVFDDDSLMETLAAQASAAGSAQALYPGRPLWISPITLKPRFNPNATGSSEAEGERGDDRQRSRLAAAWTVGSVKSLAAAAGITYFETTGPLGVLAGGDLFPVYEALAAIGGCAGGWSVPVISSRPQRVECLALRPPGGGEGSLRVILVNLTPEVQRVVFPESRQEQTLPPYAVRPLAY